MQPITITQFSIHTKGSQETYFYDSFNFLQLSQISLVKKFINPEYLKRKERIMSKYLYTLI